MPRVSRKENRPVSQRQRASLAKMTCGFGKGEPAVYPEIPNTPCKGRGERLERRADARAAAGDPVSFVLGWLDIAV